MNGAPKLGFWTWIGEVEGCGPPRMSCKAREGALGKREGPTFKI
jgi:hypothetical protein